MVHIDVVPNEILLRIFSYFKKFELLTVEETCFRWKSLIQEHIWNRLTSINQDTIGQPLYDYMNNFIEIVHRVHRIKYFHCNFMFNTLQRLNPDGPGRIMEALLEMVRKRTSDAVLPLELCDDIVELACPRRQPGRRALCNRSHSEVMECLNQFEMDQFEAIRVALFVANNFDLDMFRIALDGNHLDIPINKSRIKRMLIWYFEARFGRTITQEVESAKNNILQVSQLPNLEIIEIKQFKFVLYSIPNEYDYNEDEAIEFEIEFKKKFLQLNSNQFSAFLQAFSHDKDIENSRLFAKFIDECKRKGDFETGTMVIIHEEWMRIRSLFGDYHRHGGKSPLKTDPVCIFIHSLFPGFFTFLIFIKFAPNEESEFLALLQMKNLVCRIESSSSLFFGKCNDQTGKHVSWDDPGTTRHVITRLQCQKAHL